MNSKSRFALPRMMRIAMTLLLAWAAALLCARMHVPIPWMIGPLIATALASMAALPTTSSSTFRNAGQWTIGVALGLYFTPEVTELMLSLWWAVALAVVWTLALGMAFGVWLHRVHAHRMQEVPQESMRATSYFASAIGGASEMTLLSERAGARVDLVAAAHSVRMAVVVLMVPFAMQWAKQHFNLTALDMTPTVSRVAEWPGFFWLAMASGAGAGLMRLAGRPNPWFLGPLLAAMLLTMLDVHLSAVPNWLANGAQLVIGISLGVRFSREFLRAAPRWLLSAAAGAVVMIVLSGMFAWALGKLTGVHPVTLMLATAPGGITEMAITAKVLQLGVPVVTAFQVCRLVAVLVLAEPLYRRWQAGSVDYGDVSQRLK